MRRPQLCAACGCILTMITCVQAAPLGTSPGANEHALANSGTNGLFAWAELFHPSGGTLAVQINVHLVPNTNYPYFEPSITNGDAWWLMQYKRWPYYAATNLFCGLIILRDNTGKTLPLLKPEVDNISAYPHAFNIAGAARAMRGNAMVYHGADLPRQLTPMGFNYETDALPWFKLTDYFDLETSGEYQLTVWPKIYKRSATNDDLCERIDLPPVNIPIHWTTNWNRGRF